MCYLYLSSFAIQVYKRPLQVQSRRPPPLCSESTTQLHILLVTSRPYITLETGLHFSVTLLLIDSGCVRVSSQNILESISHSFHNRVDVDDIWGSENSFFDKFAVIFLIFLKDCVAITTEIFASGVSIERKHYLLSVPIGATGLLPPYK